MKSTSKINFPGRKKMTVYHEDFKFQISEYKEGGKHSWTPTRWVQEGRPTCYGKLTTREGGNKDVPGKKSSENKTNAKSICGNKTISDCYFDAGIYVAKFSAKKNEHLPADAELENQQKSTKNGKAKRP